MYEALGISAHIFIKYFKLFFELKNKKILYEKENY